VRELILDEIRRLAKANGGQAPGVKAFTRETGIGSHKWLGVYWARWGDALAEAGFAANEWNQRLDSAEVLNTVIEVIRETGRLPNDKEWQLLRRARPSLPTSKLLRSHFGSRADLLATLQQRAAEDPDSSDIAPLLPASVRPPPLTASRSGSQDGSVYLVKSGTHYKIGRSDEIERRMKEIRVALPETAALIHTIRTDDPAGIEAYWHRRFADQRANGEWFKLSTQDVAAFRRRSYQ
jgi:hypothetical protein